MWGEGPHTVLLVHGWTGRGLQLGAFAASLAAAGYRVVAYDAPAHGAAPGHTSNLFRHTDGLMAVAKEYGPFAGVVGHSLGAAAVLLGASRRGLAADRLVLLAPAARTTALTDWFGEMTGFSPDVVERMRRRLERRFNFQWNDVEPWRLASELHNDSLIIHDHSDPEIQWSEGRHLAHSLPEAVMHTTEGLGHRRILRDPSVVDAVTDFIAERGRFLKNVSTPHESDSQSAA